jgi:hypothetical protein
MSPPVSSVLPPGPAAAGVRVRRCARHTEREAVARCPACGGAFCRECVVEHGGRLLCSACLAREAALAAAVARPARDWLAVLGRGTALAGGVLALWLLFYGVGATLLKVPPNFPDGSVWKDVGNNLDSYDNEP